jgi:hypothetical protein
VSDPYAPGWRPAYTGPNPALGDVGSGRGFGADLYQLYKAGRSELPAAAQKFAELAGTVHWTHQFSAALARNNWHGYRAHLLWEQLRDDLQRALANASLILDEAGRRLVETADRYSRTDEEAAVRMRELLDQQSEPSPTPPVPPRPPMPEDFLRSQRRSDQPARIA